MADKSLEEKSKSKIGDLYRGKKRPQSAIDKGKETVALNRAIKNEVYTELKSQLLAGRAHPYYSDFLKTYLARAKEDPDSRAAQTVADTIFKQEILSLLDEQHDREMANDREFMRYKLLKQFFREQREVIYEVNHAKQIIACCSRRAGKTDLASGAIVSSAMTPHSRVIYINLTYSNAISQIFDNVVDRSDRCGLQIQSSSKASGEIIWTNGSSLRVVGNSNNAEADKLRGEKQVSLVVIDEFFHQRNLEYALNEVISPLMLDRKDSCLLCLGTPPRAPHTFGEKCWNEKSGWTKFRWTFRENPYIPSGDKLIQDLCTSKGLTPDAPFIQREYFGVIGSYDTEAMVFKDYKTFTDAPAKFKHIVIGVDLGFEDDNGVVALAFNDASQPAYVIEERKFNHAAVSETIQQIRDVYEHCRKICDDVTIYSDCSSKELVYELYSVQHLPAYTCYKHDKSLAIQQLAEWCRTGKILVRDRQFLSDEFERILYKRDDEDSIIPEIDDEIFHPNIMMALLYASRQYWYDIGESLGGQSSVAKTEWSGLEPVDIA